MFVIRSISVAKNGRRDEAATMMKEMAAEITKDLGFPTQRVMTASIGPSDNTIVVEGEFGSLAEFDKSLDAMNRWSGMQKYGPKFGELFIDGSHRYEIYRVV